MIRHFLIIYIFLMMITSQIFAANIYYIDATRGNDLNDGLSLETAWKTIKKANNELQPGDTAYIRGGIYQETIRPERSGTKGNYITYARYNNEEGIITGVTYGVDLRERHYIVIDGLKITNTAHWIYMRYAPSTHNIIKDCYLDECTSGWAGIFMGGSQGREGKSNHNLIINNTLIGHCNPDNLIQCSYGANHNLIEGNEFFYGPHCAVEIIGGRRQTHYNIVKNNTFHNYYHTAINVYTNADYTLIEGNIILDSGENHLDNACGTEKDRTNQRYVHAGIQIGASYCIIRRNTLINNGRMSIDSWADGGATSQNNRIYHNTFNKNYRALQTNCDGSVDGNVVKNNIFYNNREYEINRNVSGTPRNDFFVNNNILGALIKFSPYNDTNISFLESNYPSLWYDNMKINPLFIDENRRNLRLKPDSPMIDAGAFLTKITNSGSGTEIPVEDARYFMNGWGIIDGDLIQLEGQKQSVRIIDVDYKNNIIKIDTYLTWYIGQGVSLPYYGLTPDIGAYESLHKPTKKGDRRRDKNKII